MNTSRFVRFPGLVLLPLVAFVLIAAGCSAAPNRPPVVQVGDDRAVSVGETVTLDGSGSSDPDGDDLSFSWLLETPGDSTASLADAETAAPSFTADVGGEYVASLTVSDGALESTDAVTVTAVVDDTPVNGRPVAGAGEDQSVTVGDVVTLDGSASSDPDGDDLSFAWELVERPEGSTASLTDGGTASPSFTADLGGEYLASLTVSDGELEASDSVRITANEPPNEPPSLSSIDDQRTVMNESIEIPFTISDEDPAGVAVSASSSDEGLVAEADLQVSGDGTSRTLRVVPASMGVGSVEISLMAQDGGGLQGSASFTLEIARPFARQLPRLTASDAAPGDALGYSVALDGDRAIFGAPLGAAGAAYVFERTGDGWEQVSKLTADDGVDGDLFGASVAVDGDYALVGAPNHATAAGAAYVFVRSGGAWSQTDKLVASDAADDDNFGRSVAMSGGHALVGAYGQDEHGSKAGAAYVFVRGGGDWSELDKLSADDASDGDQFGFSVAVDGTRAVIGANLHQVGSDVVGAAYVFDQGDGGAWSQVAKLTADDGSPGDQFGRAVALSGTRALIGGSFHDQGVTASGAGYLFELVDESWDQMEKLTAEDADPRDQFGSSVSISGDYALLSAPQQQGDFDQTGAAYVFQHSGGAWNHTTKLTAADAAEADAFGLSVAIDGDHALIGAPLVDVDGSNTGAVYPHLE